MKKLRTIEGNYTFTTAEDAADIREITGHIYTRGITLPEGAFPALTNVGGYIDARGTTIPEGAFPALTSVGGAIYARGTTIPEGAFPALTSVGGYIDAEGATLPEGAFPALTNVGGSIYTRGTTIPEGAFPALTSVGGSIYTRGTTIPEGAFPALTSVGGYIDAEGATLPERMKCSVGAEIARRKHFEIVLSFGYLQADGILAKINGGPKVIGDLLVYNVTICGQPKASWAVRREDTFAHGETLAEAKYDLLFKSAKRSVDEFRSLKRSDKIDFTTSINLYRSVTGACAAGCKAFVAAKGIDKDRKYTIDEILKLTAGEYNNEALVDFAKTLEA